MLKKIDSKMIQNALNVSLMSDCKRQKIGCVVAYKNKIINSSFNTTKTHPIQKMYNIYRYDCDSTPHYLHAEIHALVVLMHSDIDWKNVTLYTARYKKNKEHGIARPCKSCMALIKHLGIKTICYTTDEGVAKEYI